MVRLSIKHNVDILSLLLTLLLPLPLFELVHIKICGLVNNMEIESLWILLHRIFAYDNINQISLYECGDENRHIKNYGIRNEAEAWVWMNVMDSSTKQIQVKTLLAYYFTLKGKIWQCHRNTQQIKSIFSTNRTFVAFCSHCMYDFKFQTFHSRCHVSTVTKVKNNKIHTRTHILTKLKGKELNVVR